jgi:tRNA(His) 5'-end guanylyltransferase
MWIAGLLFVLLGAAYLRNPMMFRRGIGLRASAGIHPPSDKQSHKKYMRILGAGIIALGFAIIALDIGLRFFL